MGLPSDLPEALVATNEALSREFNARGSQTEHTQILQDLEQLEVSSDDPDDRVFASGWKLHLITLGLCLSLLLSTLETTIVSTSLISITDALRGFRESGWIVTSYLLTYTGFLIIYAKSSDIFGRKILMIIALTSFTVFSIICGASHSMLFLIIFRALQGIGGSGIYSMVMVITPDLVPMEQLGIYMAVISSVFAISSILGPILGGLISGHSAWRWIFFLNAPAGALAIALITVILPWNYPHRHSNSSFSFRQTFTRKAYRRMDFLGASTSLTASVLLVFALQQGGTAYKWNSAPIITTLILSGVLWVTFILWERRVESSNRLQEPIFPLRLLHKRVFIGMFLNAFLTGFPFMAAIFNIPQRYQAVDDFSPSNAGYRLLPLLLCSPLASAISGLAVSKLGVPPIFILLFAGILQLLGVGLQSSLSTVPYKTISAQYGYEVLMGFGFGFGLSTLLIFVPLVIPKSDMAVAMGAITQIRVLGGTLGLSVCSTILNNHIKEALPSLVTPNQLDEILESTTAIESLDTAIQEKVRTVFAEGYNQQMRVMLYMTAAAFVSTVMMWEKPLRRPHIEPVEDETART